MTLMTPTGSRNRRRKGKVSASAVSTAITSSRPASKISTIRSVRFSAADARLKLGGGAFQSLPARKLDGFAPGAFPVLARLLFQRARCLIAFGKMRPAGVENAHVFLIVHHPRKAKAVLLLTYL